MAMPYDGDSPVKWRRLAASIRAQIRAGTLAPGEPAPPITELSARLGWARPTIAKALRTLADEGLLTRHDGLGYYVTDLARRPAEPDDAP